MLKKQTNSKSVCLWLKKKVENEEPQKSLYIGIDVVTALNLIRLLCIRNEWGLLNNVGYLGKYFNDNVEINRVYLRNMQSLKNVRVTFSLLFFYMYTNCFI